MIFLIVEGSRGSDIYSMYPVFISSPGRGRLCRTKAAWRRQKCFQWSCGPYFRNVSLVGDDSQSSTLNTVPQIHTLHLSTLLLTSRPRHQLPTIVLSAPAFFPDYDFYPAHSTSSHPQTSLSHLPVFPVNTSNSIFLSSRFNPTLSAFLRHFRISPFSFRPLQIGRASCRERVF